MIPERCAQLNRKTSTCRFPQSSEVLVRHGSKLSYDELQHEAHQALQESNYTQQEMADRLDVTRPSIAKAVTQPGPKFQQLQMQIIEALTDYDMVREETVRFRVSRKDREDE